MCLATRPGATRGGGGRLWVARGAAGTKGVPGRVALLLLTRCCFPLLVRAPAITCIHVLNMIRPVALFLVFLIALGLDVRVVADAFSLVTFIAFGIDVLVVGEAFSLVVLVAFGIDVLASLMHFFFSLGPCADFPTTDATARAHSIRHRKKEFIVFCTSAVSML